MSAKAYRRLMHAANDSLLLSQRLATAFPIRKSKIGDSVVIIATDERGLFEAAHLVERGWLQVDRRANGAMSGGIRHILTEAGVEALAALREHHRQRDAQRTAPATSEQSP